jgi:hypothetical protein
LRSFESSFARTARATYDAKLRRDPPRRLQELAPDAPPAFARLVDGLLLPVRTPGPPRTGDTRARSGAVAPLRLFRMIAPGIEGDSRRPISTG